MTKKNRLEKITAQSNLAFQKPIADNNVINNVANRIDRVSRQTEFLLESIKINRKNFVNFESTITDNLSKQQHFALI